MSEKAIQEQQNYHAALDILCEAGTLAKCPYHEHCSYVKSGDIRAAYMLANNQYSHGEHREFESRRAMTDAMKTVFEEHGVYECQHCLQESR